jgi:hypothetical protein
MQYLYITPEHQLIWLSNYPKKYHGSIDMYFDGKKINILLGTKSLTNLHIENIINSYLIARSGTCIYDCPLYPLIDDTVYKIHCTDTIKLSLFTNFISVFIADEFE